MDRTGLAAMFPKASEHLGVDPVMTSGSFMEGMESLQLLRLQENDCSLAGIQREEVMLTSSYAV